MTAVWMRVRAEVRTRLRALIALTLLVGLPAGVAIAAATGASRTDSVIDRLVAATRPPLIYMVPAYMNIPVPYGQIASLPVVTEAVLFRGFFSVKKGTGGLAFDEDLEISAPRDADLPPQRTHLIDGRLPRPGRADEAVITYRAVERFHWRIGDVVRFQLAGSGSDISGETPPKPGPDVRAKIVGVTASPGDFVGIAGAGIQFGHAFSRAFDARAATLDLYTFSLDRDNVAEFDREVSTLNNGKAVDRIDGSGSFAQVRRSFHVQAAAQWLMCLFVSLVAALIYSQSFTRQTLLQSSDNPVLSAIGMTRRDIGLLIALRGAFVTLGAAMIAAIVAAALSPLTPLGTARLAEPNPGFSLPAATFGIGIGFGAAVAFLLAVVPSLLILGTMRRRRIPERTNPSLITRIVGRLARHPAPGIGASFALEAGRGASAVPVRSSLTASIVGIAALVAALIVGASLDRVLTTPSLYGWNWDAIVPGDFAPGSKDLRDLTSNPAVASIAVGTAGQAAEFRFGTMALEGIVADPVKGRMGPTLLAGRVPRDDREVAVGPKSLDAMHVHIGDSINLRHARSGVTRRLRIVGEVVLPFESDVSTVGEGVWMPLAAGHQFDPSLVANEAIIRLASGVNRTQSIARLQNRFPSNYQGTALSGAPPRTVRDLGRMGNLPAVIAGLLAALALGTLAHMLTTSIRRRRRDLAILKAIGFARREVRSVVGWEALVFTSAALAIALPLGIIVGRWMWRLIAGYGGFAPSPAVPAIRIAIVAAAALATALLLGALPARIAARTRPALILRTE